MPLWVQTDLAKSTLANVLAGNTSYVVTKGEVTFNGKDLFQCQPM